RSLREAGIEYEFAGGRLGGRPGDPALRSADGTPDYGRIAATEAFRQGIEELRDRAGERCVALLCSEADPAACHREKLIAPALREEGVRVVHIYPDGSAGPATQPAFWEETPPTFSLLYTIGTSGRSLRQFAEALQAEGVDRVIDTRLRNDS